VFGCELVALTVFLSGCDVGFFWLEEKNKKRKKSVVSLASFLPSKFRPKFCCLEFLPGIFSLFLVCRSCCIYRVIETKSL